MERPEEPHEQAGVVPAVQTHEEKIIEIAPVHITVVEHEPSGSAEVVAVHHEPEVVRSAGRYHEFLAHRRLRRFSAAAVGVLVLGVLTALSLLLASNGAASLTRAGAGIAAALAGAGLAWGCRHGRIAALVVTWFAALAMLVVSSGVLGDFGIVPGFAGAGTVLMVLTAAFSLVTLVAATLGLASWRGERAQERILRAPRAGARGSA